MTKVGSEPISGCVKLGLFQEDFEKYDLTHTYHFMSASLESYLPLSSSYRMTSANNKIYANEQLLLVSWTSVFEFSDLKLNSRELITSCTLPAFVKLPCHLSSSNIFAHMPVIPYMCNHTPQLSSAPSLQLRFFYQCLPFSPLSPLTVMQNLPFTFATLFSTSLLYPLPVYPFFAPS